MYIYTHYEKYAGPSPHPPGGGRRAASAGRSPRAPRLRSIRQTLMSNKWLTTNVSNHKVITCIR